VTTREGTKIISSQTPGGELKKKKNSGERETYSRRKRTEGGGIQEKEKGNRRSDQQKEVIYVSIILSLKGDSRKTRLYSYKKKGDDK